MYPFNYINNFLYKLVGFLNEAYILLIGTSLISLPIIDRLIGRANENVRLDTLIIIELFAYVVFTIMVIVNYATSREASRHVGVKFNRKNLFWEVLGSFFLSVMVSFLAIAAVLLDQEFSYIAGLWLVVFFWFVILGIQYGDIGKNITAIQDGETPDSFMFFDRIFKIVKRSGEKRIEKTISGDDYLNDNDINDLNNGRDDI